MCPAYACLSGLPDVSFVSPPFMRLRAPTDPPFVSQSSQWLPAGHPPPSYPRELGPLGSVRLSLPPLRPKEATPVFLPVSPLQQRGQ
ncbi:hypothetical protein NDU88_002067 [Pleurodeles waltl]|uniref:Uncharacterized protein n=1 Tax=Pleurodeles waltl TaxID=8319 RepID=A0AAV7P799_PLEWA|nr:hypothetical protein NDU88_002067 [Pleurodeles waltl]